MQCQIFRTAQQLCDKEGMIFRVCRVRSLIRRKSRACVHPQLVWPRRAAGCVVHKSLFTWLVVWSTRACVRVHKSLFPWLVVWSTSSRACLRGWLCGPQELAYAGDCEKFLCACGHSGDCELNVWLWTHWRL